MSAIYGILYENGRSPNAEAIKTMGAGLSHRANHSRDDWQGPYADLGVCKLTVHPGQENERLPLESGGLVIVADCRLDNRETLIAHLHLDAKEGSQRPDAELILDAYRKWGADCPHYLDGEFAFAIVDQSTRAFFAATDPVGYRPFFYLVEPDRFLFCSEMKGILAVMNRQLVFDEEHLIEIYFQKGDPEHTYVKGIKALCGGKIVQFRGGEVSVRTYWQLAPRGKYRFIRDQDWFDQLRELLIKAVEKRISPLSNTGVLLSGGLDSSAIAGILATVLAAKNQPLYAFSSVLPGTHAGIERDERRFIGMMNAMYPNIVPTFVEAPGAGPFEGVEAAFDLDEMIPNSFFYMDQALLSAAREKNVSNLFTGFGGDAWVSAPTTGVYALLSQGSVAAAFRTIRELSAYDGASLWSVAKREYLTLLPMWTALKPFLRREEHPAVITHFQPGFLDHYLHQLREEPERQPGMLISTMVNSGRVSRLAGMFANRNSAYGIRSCDPLYDKDLLEFLADVPVRLFTAGGQRRGLFRQSIEGLVPPEIRWRKDKLPYSPDFIRRAHQQGKDSADIISSKRYDFVFDRYFSKESIERKLPEMEAFSGFKSKTSAQSIRTIQALIAVRTLAHLKDQGFLF